MSAYPGIVFLAANAADFVIESGPIAISTNHFQLCLGSEAVVACRSLRLIWLQQFVPYLPRLLSLVDLSVSGYNTLRLEEPDVEQRVLRWFPLSPPLLCMGPVSSQGRQTCGCRPVGSVERRFIVLPLVDLVSQPGTY